MSDAPLEYSRDTLADVLHLDPDEARQLWNAFGFAHASGDEVGQLTPKELAALSVFVGDDKAMDPTAQRAAARAIGLATARLAQWQAEAINRLTADPKVTASTDEIVDALGQVQNLVWRRHLKAGLADMARETEDAQVVVGFADIVGYTSMSRRMGMTELESLLETFESAAYTIITARGGQVIKTIGDAVMFTVQDPSAGGEIAIELHKLSSDGALPALRIGMARGRILMRMGDAFGEPVNIAARLASNARSGTTLIDGDLAGALNENESMHVNPIPSLSVRGYRKLRAYRLARARSWKP